MSKTNMTSRIIKSLIRRAWNRGLVIIKRASDLGVKAYYGVYSRFYLIKKSAPSSNGSLFSLFGFYDQGEMPYIYQKTYRQWQRLNPHTTIRIIHYQKDEVERKIAQLNPAYKTAFKHFEKAPEYERIMKCDMARYIYAYHYGWGYSDLDVEQRVPLHSLWEKFPQSNIILGVEKLFNIREISDMKPTYTSSLIGKSEIKHPYRIANYFFLCRQAGHPFWKNVIDQTCQRAARHKALQDYDVLWISGPGLISDVLWNNYHLYNDISIVGEGELWRKFYTYYTGSWRKDHKRLNQQKDTTNGV